MMYVYIQYIFKITIKSTEQVVSFSSIIKFGLTQKWNKAQMLDT